MKTAARGRREFLAAGGALAFPRVALAGPLGLCGAAAPSQRITLGVIGVGPRCRQVLGSMLGEPDVQCLAVCDVQASRRDSGKAMVDRRYGNQDCATYADFR